MNKSDILRDVSKFEYSEDGDLECTIDVDGNILKFPIALSKNPFVSISDKKEDIEKLILEELLDEILNGEYTNVEILSVKKYIISQIRDVKIDVII